MSPIKYELYEIENKELLKQIKKNIEIFRMLGFTTFEQGKTFKLGFLNNYGNLKTNYRISQNNKKIVFFIENNYQKVIMTSNLATTEKNTEFVVQRNNEKIIINSFLYSSTNYPYKDPSIYIKLENEQRKIELKRIGNSISIFNSENGFEKSLYYTDLLRLSQYEQIPYLIASYFDSLDLENNSYKRAIEVCRHNDSKGFYLETKHDYNGLRKFQDKSIILNTRKDAASYALELIETKEIQNFIHYVFKCLDESLISFSNYAKQNSIITQLFRTEIDSEIYRIYCGVQKKLHEMVNPVRIEQLLEEMTFEKEKTKTLKNKA